MVNWVILFSDLIFEHWKLGLVKDQHNPKFIEVPVIASTSNLFQ